MFAPTDYELIDFGEGRKLERFGEYVLDRTSPAADEASRRHAQRWAEANAAFSKQGTAGEWKPRWPRDAAWNLEHPLFKLELKPTPAGHLGVFPEHAERWDWVVAKIKEAEKPAPKVLNLFAYTGAASLAAARAGAEVTHIDSAKNVVQWARRNAELSELADAPIRWIAEDALRFVQREVRRGNRYQGVIADPPTYGHGPKGEVWQIEDSLPPLLAEVGRLLADDAFFVLLSCHSPGFEGPRLRRLLQDGIDRSGKYAAGPLSLSCRDGRQLAAGAYACWRPNGRNNDGRIEGNEKHDERKGG